jgi:hypoxanthine-guanine phosphoribosyltransferase
MGGIEGREIHWVAEPNISLKDRNIVIIEDILDKYLIIPLIQWSRT